MGKRTMILIFVPIIFISCTTASMVTSSGDLGGIQDGPRWGVVKYLNQGADFVINDRKADARKKMRDFCYPDNYRVVQTSTQNEWMTYQGSGGSFGYLYIKFECASD